MSDAAPVLVVGALGRMGERVRAALLEEPGLRLGAALEAPGHPELGRELEEGVRVQDDAEAALAASELAIVFATPEASLAVLRRAAAGGTPCVVGTTGFDATGRAELESLAGKLPLLVAANFSVAVNVLFHLTRRAAALLGPGFDAEILELHHAAKLDAPSGTALRLGAAVAEGRHTHLEPHAVLAREGHTGPRPAGAIGIQTLRGGDNPGEHTVHFVGRGERLELVHRSATRDHFARGAVRAASWLRTREPGLYDMEQVLGLEELTRVAPDRVGLFTGIDMESATRLRAGAGEAAVLSCAAPHREGPNQDGAAVLEGPGASVVLAVADGVGGHAAGARASAVALRTLAAALESAPAEEPLRPRVIDAIEEAHRSIRELAVGAATTLAVAEISEGTLRTYHVGDSAVLLVGGRGRIRLQTIAHSPVGYGVAAGMLDEDEALQHEERHLISNALGADDMRVEVRSPVPMAPRDTVLLASDGLLDNLEVGEIAERARRSPLATAAEALGQLARGRMLEPREDQPSKPDDLTFVLWRRAAAPRRAKDAKPG